MKRIYMDHSATTPVAPEVQAAMLPYFGEKFGNASSLHRSGREAKEALEDSREKVAALLGARAEEIIFTSGGTESDNLALKGIARKNQKLGKHIITTQIEHPAILETCRALEKDGFEVTYLPVTGEGLVELSTLEAAIRPDTILISVMHANNEVGTINPVAGIAALAHANGSLVHTDAAQSAGKVTLDVAELGADLLTLAGHKFYGPKGIGALYVRRGTAIRPILFGADQEHGLRPGTENVAQIVGAGETARLARSRLPHATRHLATLRDELHRRLAAGVPGLLLNGHPEQRLPNTLHVSFPGVSGRDLLATAHAIAASVGSACHSDADAVSGVLAAMGCDAARARGAVRLSVGFPTSLREIELAAAALIDAWRQTEK